MKTAEKEKTNDRPHGNAYQIALYEQSASEQPPEFKVTAEATTKDPCDRRIVIPDGTSNPGDEIDEIVLRDKLAESYSRQTIAELITLNSNDNKGSNDPYTQYVHAFYSPADEFDDAIKTIHNLPDIMNSLDDALSTGAPDRIEVAAEKLWEASKDLPGTPITGLPKSKKDVFKIKKILEMLYREYEVFVKEQIFEGGCDPENQKQNKAGHIVDYNWFLNSLRFISSKGEGMVSAYYSDLPSDQWWQDEDTGDWYVKASYLPTLEAKVESRK